MYSNKNLCNSDFFEQCSHSRGKLKSTWRDCAGIKNVELWIFSHYIFKVDIKSKFCNRKSGGNIVQVL